MYVSLFRRLLAKIRCSCLNAVITGVSYDKVRAIAPSIDIDAEHIVAQLYSSHDSQGLFHNALDSRGLQGWWPPICLGGKLLIQVFFAVSTVSHCRKPFGSCS